MTVTCIPPLEQSLTWNEWSIWKKKKTILLIVGLSASVVGAFGPVLSPGRVLITADLGVSVNALAQSTAWLILTHVLQSTE